MLERNYLIPDLVDWQDGMLLTPVHLKQVNERHDNHILQHTQLTSPFYYGLFSEQELEFSKDKLYEGILRIKKLKAVMPGGFIVQHADSDNNILEIDLNKDEEIKKIQKPQNIIIYLSASKKTDEYKKKTQDNGIPVIKPTLSLSVKKKLDSLPLLKIHCSDMDNFEYYDNYLSPLIHICKDSKIYEICEEIVYQVRSKIDLLLKQSEFNTESKLIISILSSYLTPFEVMMTFNLIRPYQLFLIVSSLISGISVFQQEGSDEQLSLPPRLTYDHNNLLHSFDKAKEKLSLFLDSIMIDYIPRKFIKESENNLPIFSIELEKGWLTNPLLIGVKKPYGEEWIEKSIICDQNTKDKREIGTLERTDGAYRKKRKEFDGFKPHKSYDLFLIDTDSDFIHEGQKLLIFINFETNGCPDEIVLYVKNQ